MSLIRNLKCCVTGKALSEMDNIICFPKFLNGLQNPKELVAQFQNDPNFRYIYECSECCALRSAFDAWQLRETVLEKAKNSFIKQAHHPPYRVILWQSEKYILQRIQHQNRILLYFLNSLLILDAPKQYWVSFFDDVDTFSDHTILQSLQEDINFVREDNKMVIIKRWKSGIFHEAQPYESIKLSLSEWNTLVNVIREHLSNLS